MWKLAIRPIHGGVEGEDRLSVELWRLTEDPIIAPDPAHPWESAAVFNAGVVQHEGRVYLLYRACERASDGSQGPYISRLGLAQSRDGVHFNRLPDPVFEPQGEWEQRGVEDPRIVALNGTFYALYTAFGGRHDQDYRIALASSPDLYHWHRHGVLLDEPNKDASFFPRQVGGWYWLLHRREPHIWIARSQDLSHWTDHRVLMETRSASWDSKKIGIAGPPVETEAGWLLIYHGVDSQMVYRLGIALLDRDDPTRVRFRQLAPILEPRLSWELSGWVPNVVFSCGQAVLDEALYVYYAGADRAIGVGTLSLSQIQAEVSLAIGA